MLTYFVLHRTIATVATIATMASRDTPRFTAADDQYLGMFHNLSAFSCGGIVRPSTFGNRQAAKWRHTLFVTISDSIAILHKLMLILFPRSITAA
jgi:hypothetical protein